MSVPHDHIHSIVTLGSVTPDAVGSVLGVSFVKERERPSWEFYEAGPAGVITMAVLNLSRTDTRWLVGWEYDVAKMPREDELDLSRYGTPK